jgi:hypothetical protein
MVNFQIYLIESFVLLSDIQNSEKIPDSEDSGDISSDAFYKMIDIIDQNISSIFFDVIDSLIAKNKAIFETVINKDFTIFLIFLILFICSTCLGYFVFVYPKADEMKNRVLMTIRLLGMIPPRIISGTASIRNYLNEISI